MTKPDLYLEDLRVGQVYESGSHRLDTAQIKAFAKLYPRDVRAAQPLNGRIVKESQ